MQSAKTIYRVKLLKVMSRNQGLLCTVTLAIASQCLFQAIAKKYSRSAKIWLDQLAKIPMQDVESIFRQIPEHRISSVAVNFSLQMLEINKNRLLTERDHWY